MIRPGRNWPTEPKIIGPMFQAIMVPILVIALGPNQANRADNYWACDATHYGANIADRTWPLMGCFSNGARGTNRPNQGPPLFTSIVPISILQ